jgi:CheY-like chemotaxis protein
MKTVLFIEDNNDIRENTCELLELEGYNVIFAENGKIGLALAKANHPDIIVCDIQMPEIDGYEVLNILKNDPSTSQIPFIFLSASVEKKNISIGLNMGAKAYIQKPFDPEELFNIVAQTLEQE